MITAARLQYREMEGLRDSYNGRMDGEANGIGRDGEMKHSD